MQNIFDTKTTCIMNDIFQENDSPLCYHHSIDALSTNTKTTRQCTQPHNILFGPAIALAPTQTILNALCAQGLVLFYVFKKQESHEYTQAIHKNHTYLGLGIN